MKITATELMKKLKFIEEELNDIYSDDKINSTVLMEKKTDNDGETTYNPAFANEYDFASNRKKVKELFNEERKIKNVLNTFNNNTLVDGYDFNINEGLVRLAELKKEISTLTILAKKTQFFSTTNYNREISVYKSCYNIEDAKNILKETQRELSALQVAIDKTNLNSSIEF
ncbi:MAG: hypothetical protein MR659_02450 [Mollicutes bacterium]|nr:hypothetical protein [Mollicutes bacterium]MDD7714769.1 hypothetical protein [Mollicutes bacterium]